MSGMWRHKNQDVESMIYQMYLTEHANEFFSPNQAVFYSIT